MNIRIARKIIGVSSLDIEGKNRHSTYQVNKAYKYYSKLTDRYNERIWKEFIKSQQH